MTWTATKLKILISPPRTPDSIFSPPLDLHSPASYLLVNLLSAHFNPAAQIIFINFLPAPAFRMCDWLCPLGHFDHNKARGCSVETKNSKTQNNHKLFCSILHMNKLLSF